jgi:hypothetical protein
MKKMPAPPLAAKGSAGKGEDSPHLLVIGPDRESARRSLSSVSRHERRMTRPIEVVNKISSLVFVIFITNHARGEAVAPGVPSDRIAGAPMSRGGEEH